MKTFTPRSKFGTPRANRFGGRGSTGRGSRGSFGGGRGAMHEAVCAECGNICQVPFEPVSGRPIYCSDCFERRGNGMSDREDMRTPRRSPFEKPVFSERRPFSAPQAAPLAQAPQSRAHESKQLDMLNSKLDMIVSLLKNMAQKNQPEATVILADVAKIVKTEKPASVKGSKDAKVAPAVKAKKPRAKRSAAVVEVIEE